jgi:hypothetical protein
MRLSNQKHDQIKNQMLLDIIQGLIEENSSILYRISCLTFKPSVLTFMSSVTDQNIEARINDEIDKKMLKNDVQDNIIR